MPARCPLRSVTNGLLRWRGWGQLKVAGLRAAHVAGLRAAPVAGLRAAQVAGLSAATYSVPEQTVPSLGKTAVTATSCAWPSSPVIASWM
jgi:hypothetical protein